MASGRPPAGLPSSRKLSVMIWGGVGDFRGQLMCRSARLALFAMFMHSPMFPISRTSARCSGGLWIPRLFHGCQQCLQIPKSFTTANQVPPCLTKFHEGYKGFTLFAIFTVPCQVLQSFTVPTIPNISHHFSPWLTVSIFSSIISISSIPSIFQHL